MWPDKESLLFFLEGCVTKELRTPQLGQEKLLEVRMVLMQRVHLSLSVKQDGFFGERNELV